jgi:signal peptidase II
LRKYLFDYGFLFTLSGIIIAADQWTKWLVRTRLPYGGQWAPWSWLLPYVRIVHIQNTGAAFGIFQRFGDVFMVLSVIVAAAILVYFSKIPRNDWLVRLVMGMEMGGAVGNLIDRLTQGYVTDFVSVGEFAVFNVADASISVGMTILLIGLWMRERRQKSSTGAFPSQDQNTPQPTSEPQQENPQGE